MKRVLLFKADSNRNEKLDNVPDRYLEILTTNNFYATTILVIDFEFCNLNVLKEKLENHCSYSGIICTSPRSVNAVSECISQYKVSVSGWKHLSNYVVGEWSQSLLQNLGIFSDGSHCGNVENLCDVILEKKYEKPLLYVTGNLTRDHLRHKLSSNEIIVDEIVVYKTIQHPSLSHTLEKVFSEQDKEFAFVYFSPSGVQNSIPLIKQLGIDLSKIKFVAIGPTTAQAIKDSDLPVSAVASKPKPESLLQALLEL